MKAKRRAAGATAGGGGGGAAAVEAGIGVGPGIGPGIGLEPGPAPAPGATVAGWGGGEEGAGAGAVRRGRGWTGWLPWILCLVVIAGINSVFVFVELPTPGAITDTGVHVGLRVGLLGRNERGERHWRQPAWAARLSNPASAFLRRASAAAAAAPPLAAAAAVDFDGDAVALTIFTVLKELPANAVELSASNQRVWSELHTMRVAVRSWVRLPVNILLFADTPTCAIVADHILGDLDPAGAARRVRCVPFPCVNERFNAPTYDCIFEAARARATTELLMYSNSDIVFFHDLCDVAREMARLLEDFVIVGKRRDVRLPVMLDPLEPSDAAQMQMLVRQDSVLHGKFGIDYFIFRAVHLPEMLPFLVGRVRWDNWLLAQYLRWTHAHSVDASAAILAGHHSLRPLGESATRAGSTYNVNMTLGTVVDPKKVGSIEQTEWAVVDVGPNPLVPPVRQDSWWQSGGSGAAAAAAANHAADGDVLPEDLADDDTGSGPGESGTGNDAFSRRQAVLRACTRLYPDHVPAPPPPGLAPIAGVTLPQPALSHFLAVDHGTCRLRCCRLTRTAMDLDSLLYASEVDRTVVLVPVDSPSLPLALNWNCHARRTGIHNAVFLTLDPYATAVVAAAGLRWLELEPWNASTTLAVYAASSSFRTASTSGGGSGGGVAAARCLHALARLLAILDAALNILRKQVSVVLTRADVLPSLNFLPLMDPEAGLNGQSTDDADTQHGAVQSGLLRFAATNEGRKILVMWRNALAVQTDALAARAAASDPGLAEELEQYGLPFDPYELLSDHLRRTRPTWTVMDSSLLQTRAGLRAAAAASSAATAGASGQAGGGGGNGAAASTTAAALVWPAVIDMQAFQPTFADAHLPSNVTAAVRTLDAAGGWLLTRHGSGTCRTLAFPPVRASLPHPPRRGWTLVLIVTVPPLVGGGPLPSEALQSVGRALLALDLSAPPDTPEGGGWLTADVILVLPPAPTGGRRPASAAEDSAGALCDDVRSGWTAGAVRCLRPVVDGSLATPPPWAQTWFPLTAREVGIFLTAPDVLEPHAPQVLLNLLNAVDAADQPEPPAPSLNTARPSSNAAGGELNTDGAALNAAAATANLYGIGLVTSLKSVPFAKKPVGLAPAAGDPPLLLWRYQRALPSGMAWFGPAYAQFLGWLAEQWPRVGAPGGWTPTVAGMKAGAVTDMTTWQNRFIAERGAFALYAGPGLGTLVASVLAPGSGSTGGGKASVPPLPPLPETPQYDLYANRAGNASVQYFDGRALVLDA